MEVKFCKTRGDGKSRHYDAILPKIGTRARLQSRTFSPILEKNLHKIYQSVDPLLVFSGDRSSQILRVEARDNLPPNHLTVVFRSVAGTFPLNDRRLTIATLTEFWLCRGNRSIGLRN
ncbi:MAG: hypothetical protein D6728_20350 [Cyanobacteria bacterium J055]|nr:MAG: hypothetical protein D6728_20350 [Cyanobacteria bacterium J055]